MCDSVHLLDQRTFEMRIIALDVRNSLQMRSKEICYLCVDLI